MGIATDAVLPVPTRRGRGALTGRVSAGHVAMVVAGLLGAVLTLSLLRAADETRPVLALATDVEPGELLDGASLRVERVHAGDDVMASLFPGDEMDSVRGLVAVNRMRSGELLSRTAVAPAAGAGAARAMSFPIPRSRAVGGDLERGDRIDVVAVDQRSGSGAHVLVDAEVLAVDTGGDGPLGAGDDVTVTVAVEPEDAVRLAVALHAGPVTLVRSTGAPAASNASGVVPGPDPAARGDDGSRPDRSGGDE